jgi:hypothetical protein
MLMGQTNAGGTHRTANFRGAVRKTGVGSSARHATKKMAAITLRPPKMRRRSHRLTAECQRSSQRVRQSSKAQREERGQLQVSCRGREANAGTSDYHAAAFAACAGAVSHGGIGSGDEKRLTRKPSLLLLSPGRRRKRSAGAFVSWQPDIATVREGVQRLQTRQQRSG